MVMEIQILMVMLFSVSHFPIAISISASDGGYNWKIDIVRLVNNSPTGRWQFVKLTDLSCTRDSCNDIYAKTRALHNLPHIDDDNEFSRMTAGMNPRVMMMIKETVTEELHIVNPLVVESDHCMCLQNATFKWTLSGLPQSNCLSGTTVCELVFVSPIPVTKHTVSVMVTVESFEASLFIPPKSIVFYNTNNFSSLERVFKFESFLTLNMTMETEVLQVKQLSEGGGPWMLAVGKQYLTTTSEFETWGITKIILPDMTLPCICHNWDVDIKDVLCLADRLLVASKFGLLQYGILDRSDQRTDPVRILEVCIDKVAAGKQASSSAFYVMALSNNSGTFFHGQGSVGADLMMKRASNSMNESLCQFLAKGLGCEVRGFALSAMKADKVFLLVEADQYLLVEYSVNTASFKIIKVLSQANVQNSRLPAFTMRSFALVDLSFTRLPANHLFIWGNTLLYSPNAGQVVFEMIDLKNESIKIFETSYLGDFVFVTSLGKVFFGKCGSLSIRRLRSVEAPRRLTAFFDSTGALYQLVVTKEYCNSSVCLKKVRVPLREALQRENAYQKISNQYRFCTQSCRGKCAQSAVHSCHIDPSKSTKLERTCPFAKIKVTSSQFLFFSRISLTLHCRDKLNSDFATKIDEVGPGLFWKEKITADSQALGNCLWEDPSHESQRLPAAISLGRAICYEFSIHIHLDHSDFQGVYFHSFNLADVQLTAIISKPDDLVIKLNRSTSYADDSVKYQVQLCDSGKRRAQNPPGTGHEIVSPELKVIGAELNCIANSYQETEDIQGYFAPKVLLGCPAGQKVVFDPALSKSKGKAQYCDDDPPSVPCFHFDRVFSPVFHHVDEATLKRDEFSGNYTLIIVAGGTRVDAVHYFNEEEKALFNYEAGSSLIWAPQQNYEGKPIFTKHSNSLRWLCRSNSPCSGIAPIFPHPPVFYFIIEFSNRDVDNSNCDFTFHFAIRIEGIAPGSINPSLITVLISIGLMILGLLVYFFLKKRYNHVLERYHWMHLVRLFKKPGRVETSEPPPPASADQNTESV